MEQPRWDDDAVVWRRFAGDLRQRAGAAYRRAREAEARAVDAQRIEDRARASTRRNRWCLTRIEKLLYEGDVPAAVDLLATRRAWIKSRAE